MEARTYCLELKSPSCNHRISVQGQLAECLTCMDHKEETLMHYDKRCLVTVKVSLFSDSESIFV